MKKSLITTLVLAGVFLMLVGGLAIYEKKIKPGQADKEDAEKTLVTVKPQDIQEIEVVRMKNAPPESADASTPMPATPEYETVQMRKVGQDWNLVTPVQDLADSGYAHPNVTNIATAKYERVVDDKPTDLEQFGLKNPILKITVKKSSADPGETISIGKNTPTGFSSYLMIGSRPGVYRVARSIRTAFDKDLKAIRNKLVFYGTTRDAVNEVEVQVGKDNFLLKKEEKDGQAEWFLAREHIPADSNEVNKLLNALIEEKVVEFASNDGKNLEAFGLSAPLVRVWLIKKGETAKMGVSIGLMKDKVYLKREDKPFVYQVSNELLPKVRRPATEYRSQRLANFNRFDVKRVKLERGKEVLDLAKDATGWTLASDPGFKIDTAKVDGLLTSLQDTKITNYLTANAKATAKAPTLTVRLFEEKNKVEKERLSLTFSGPQGLQMLIQRSDIDVPFLINKDDYKKIDLAQKDFELTAKKEDKKDAKKEPEKKS